MQSLGLVGLDQVRLGNVTTGWVGFWSGWVGLVWVRLGLIRLGWVTLG